LRAPPALRCACRERKPVPRYGCQAPSVEPLAGDAADLGEGGHALYAEADAVAAQGRHARGDGGRGDLARRALEQATDLALDEHELEEPDAPAVAGVATRLAPAGAEELDLVRCALGQPELLQFACCRRVRAAALGAESAREPLS